MLQNAFFFLQKSEPIQPKTSNILPKFCQPTLSGLDYDRLEFCAAEEQRAAFAAQLELVREFSLPMSG